MKSLPCGYRGCVRPKAYLPKSQSHGIYCREHIDQFEAELVTPRPAKPLTIFNKLPPGGPVRRDSFRGGV